MERRGRGRGRQCKNVPFDRPLTGSQNTQGKERKRTRREGGEKGTVLLLRGAGERMERRGEETAEEEGGEKEEEEGSAKLCL